MKKKLAFDFDGVIHADTSSGGFGTLIPDPPVPGAIEKLREVLSSDEIERVFIFSLRCGGEQNMQAMHGYLERHFFARYPDMTFDEFVKMFNKISYSWVKPQADVYIDDRALEFKGDWNDPKFSIEALTSFKPWNR